MSFLEVSNISFEEAGNVVLNQISFTQQKLQKIAIAGETGSGKSTLLQTIAGLIQPHSGKVYFNGKAVTGPHDQLIPGHPGIAYLSQHFELPQFLRVEQILNYANKLSAAAANALYDLCRISHLLKRRTDQLSGGERQRIALARLLLASPKLLLLDEPFSNLDIQHKNTLKAVVQGVGEQLKISLILISHDPQDTLSWADEILVLHQGQIIQKGSPRQIYQNPVNTYTAALFGSYNLLPAETAKALMPLAHIIPDKKSILIRPEDFYLTTAEKKAIPGKVNQVKYYGSYYETEVLIKDTIVTVKTHANNLQTGDSVYLALATEKIWFV